MARKAKEVPALLLNEMEEPVGGALVNVVEDVLVVRLLARHPIQGFLVVIRY